MENKSQHIEVQELILKVLTEEATSLEREKLSDWIKASRDNENYYQEELKLWNKLEKSKTVFDIDVEKEWQKIKQNIKPVSKVHIEKSKPASAKFLYRIAAAIILVAIAASVLYYFSANPAENKLMAQNEVKNYTLPDGSVITLNKNAVITYPKAFGKRNRKVKLEKGEAFFDVVSDVDNPFYVETSEVKIKVIGTSFYINTEEDGNVIVIVDKGVVTVYKNSNENEMIEIKEGDKAVFSSKTKEIVKTINEDDNFMVWKTNKLIFRNKKLSKIIDSINKHYNSHLVIVNDNINDCRFSTQFDKNLDIDNVLNILRALDLDVNQTQNSIEISGEGC